jgi:hypothetical protein
MVIVVDAVWKRIITDTARTPLEPGEKAGPNIAGEFELDRTSGLLLNHHCPGSNFRPRDQVTGLDRDQIASAELAVDREIEQRTVSNPSFSIQEETDCPDLHLRQGTLGPHGLACIPCSPTSGCSITFQVSYGRDWPKEKR